MAYSIYMCMYIYNLIKTRITGNISEYILYTRHLVHIILFDNHNIPLN